MSTYPLLMVEQAFRAFMDQWNIGLKPILTLKTNEQAVPIIHSVEDAQTGEHEFTPPEIETHTSPESTASYSTISNCVPTTKSRNSMSAKTLHLSSTLLMPTCNTEPQRLIYHLENLTTQKHLKLYYPKWLLNHKGSLIFMVPIIFHGPFAV